MYERMYDDILTHPGLRSAGHAVSTPSPINAFFFLQNRGSQASS